MVEICLWGNATDLSLLTNLSYDDIQKLQGTQARKNAEKNVLVNKLPETYDLLSKARAEGKPERRVDFVLDNAGFELYVDLILAGYLLASGLATQVVLRPKSIPWFVSDVLPGDFTALLNAIANPRAFFETPSDDEKLQGKTPQTLTASEVDDLTMVFQDWASLHADGQLIMRPNRYWTAGGSYWRLPHEAPELLEDLKKAELVIYKGDLNYRKLTGDVSFAGPCPPHSLLPETKDRKGTRNLPLIRPTGSLGHHNALRDGHWAHGLRFRCQRSLPAHLQSRCRRRPAARQGRRAEGHRGRRRRLGRQEMGLVWQVGRHVPVYRLIAPNQTSFVPVFVPRALVPISSSFWHEKHEPGLPLLFPHPS